MSCGHRRTIRAVTSTLVAAAIALTTGCGIDLAYILPAVGGELEILLHSVPIEEAITSGNLSDDHAERLRLILDVRTFADETLGLSVGNQYSTFYNAGGEPVAFNVSASRRDRFEPFIWTFPFVGSLPFLVFFDTDEAFARRDRLVAQEYDVFVYEVDAYFAGGFIPNPILSPMLDRPEESLIDTVIHELLHVTISRTNDASFNESLATFVGRTGALQFIDQHLADEPERHDVAIARFEDADRYSEFLLSLFHELDAYYGLNLPDEAKITGREAVYQSGRDRFVAEVLPLMNLPENYDWVADLPVNNALMLGVRRYNLDLAAFQRVFDDLAGDWRAALAVYRQAAKAPDAYRYLGDWTAPDASAKLAPAAANQARAPVPPDGFATCPACRARTLISGSGPRQ